MMETLDAYWAIAKAHWLVIGAVLIVVSFTAMIAFFQYKRDNSYDFLDTLKGENGKASQDALIVYFMAALAAWYIVVKTLNPAAGNAGADLVQILLIFLVYRLGKKGVESWEKKPSAPPSELKQGDNIGQQVVIPGAEAPAVPAAPVIATATPKGAIKMKD